MAYNPNAPVYSIPVPEENAALSNWNYLKPPEAEVTGALEEAAYIRNPGVAASRWADLIYEDGFGDSPTLTPQEAEQKYGMGGHLKFQEPIKEWAAYIMMQRKKEELHMQDVISRGRPGFIRSMGIGFKESLKDPLNIASMFIPVLGEERIVGGVVQAGRFASLATKLSRMGPIAGRAGRGAIEGGVGALVVEPLVLYGAQAEQADYSLDDSLLNLGTGTILGAGLHSLGGIPSFLRELKAETRGSMAADAIAQVSQGKPVEVADIIQLDRNVVREQAKAKLAKEGFIGPVRSEPVIAPVKLPHEMTRAEFAESRGITPEEAKTTTTTTASGMKVVSENTDLTNAHAAVVERAILEGRTIPDSVLDEHPSLVSKYGGRIEREPGTVTASVKGKATEGVKKPTEKEVVAKAVHEGHPVAAHVLEKHPDVVAKNPAAAKASVEAHQREFASGEEYSALVEKRTDEMMSAKTREMQSSSKATKKVVTTEEFDKDLPPIDTQNEFKFNDSGEAKAQMELFKQFEDNTRQHIDDAKIVLKDEDMVLIKDIQEQSAARIKAVKKAVDMGAQCLLQFSAASVVAPAVAAPK